ncbi:MAG: DUF1513 domain-containing protein [Magnetospirillum sp.]
MVTNRRAFLAACAAFGLVPGLTRAASLSRDIWLAANVAPGRQYALGAFDADGNKVFEVDLPERGHGIALSPDGRTAAAVARRPGTSVAVIDVASGQAIHWLEAPEGRHFHGHGLFSPDGKVLFTSENDYQESVGIIGLWDATDNYTRLGEMSSHGIEPHDIKLMPDGRTLAVANGGIITHPDHGRTRLNLDAMESSLVYMDSRDGRLLEKRILPAALRLLSMRHFDIAPDGTIAMGMQHQTNTEMPPIVALHRRGEDLRLLDLPPDIKDMVHNYCGSVAFSPDGSVFAASCPQGSVVTLWRTTDSAFLGTVAIKDGCGIAPGIKGRQLIMTSGRQGVWRWSPDGAQALKGEYVGSRAWDNHAVRLG